MNKETEIIVAGSGPNGLAAAILLAAEGYPVTVLEAADTVGGGTRTQELTLPGFRHDVCSAIHPLGAASPFLSRLPLAEYGLEWIYPEAALAHPFDDGTAALLYQDLKQTAGSLDPSDRRPYQQLMEPLLGSWEELAEEVLAPIHFPKHPLVMARFGTLALRSATGLARSQFRGERAAALFAGLSAHSFLPLERPGSAAFGLILGLLGHVNGWPVAKGGSAAIPTALVAHLESLGGRIRTATPLRSVENCSPNAVFILDLTPRQALKIAGSRFDAEYRRRLEEYRYGPGIFKIDWALSGPIPWTAPGCRRAATVHLGGTLDEIAASEREVWQGKPPERPFVLVAQQSVCDPTRAPEGKHTGWAYCHVPNGSIFDMTDRIEAQIERFAPGFADLILARNTRDTAEIEAYNENFVGGDINGGVQDLGQIVARPVPGLHPYATSDRNIFLCSASTPPGGGVHGMCGYHAARCALERLRHG
ncbi:phytoene desaturase family protein [Geomesophilobacter sediminis]|uniref:Pyridine nucleotide-disulfide oxidoreductase domain-containing protein 2 n=1 Tax=Geomesophilobacter sediminis TaxID=2798584 RepID=A0A8J7LVY2_9BACT|nr:NAD(P)/FAD-dependent oxidoreductase [Geomesophilobacter sediminis]MBJ6726089.1 NAD(P)/FAD-dependent oxidoreductase [Geomesophilobacter sediminis]